MTIVCNTRCMNAPLTGVQRYTEKILGSFPQKIENVQPSPSASRGLKGHAWEQLALPFMMRKRLLWSPSNSGPISYSRQVVTIHDVVSVDHPEWFTQAYVKWYNYMLPRLCKNALHIITISEFSKQRIMELFKVPYSKITMIYNGTGDLKKQSGADHQPLKIPFERYVLSLGSLEPRKNIPLLLQAWQSLLKRIPEDIGLVIVGGKGSERIFKDAGLSQIPDRVYFTGHIADEHVSQLYLNSLFFVYLSVYEGFGLPPLEAMSVGTPVITGNRTSLPEVVGNAGLLIDPYSMAECENAMLTLINDQKLRMELSARSAIQANRFDWENTSRQTWDVLQQFD
jgi:glycosyltransferase involved in cell wall biosynthesis